MNPEKVKKEYFKTLKDMSESENPQDRRSALAEWGKVYRQGQSDKDDLKIIQSFATQRFHMKTIARQIMPIISIDPHTLEVPVLHKEAEISKENITSPLYEAVDGVREAEDKLMLIGEHEGWPALGLEGLATATGRHEMASCGRYPENIVTDIIQARRCLKNNQHGGGVLIVGSDVDQALDETYWYPEKENTPPVTYRTYLEKEGLVEAILVYPDLCNEKGEKNNALFVFPSQDSFVIKEGLPMEVHGWKNSEDEVTLVVRESVAPKIIDPTTIVEITDITTL